MTENHNLLKNISVLVTRPTHMAIPLCDYIESAGGHAVHFPVIEIEDLQLTSSDIPDLDNISIAIFISPTAVQKTFRIIGSLPEQITVAAIGSSTARELVANNVKVSIFPENGFESEGLLAETGLETKNIRDKLIVIFKGEGGRALLEDTLVERGANVIQINLYRRIIPKPQTPLNAGLLNHIDIIAVTSSEGLSNLFTLTENKQDIINIPLIVPGKRCQKLAVELGSTHIIESGSATDESCINSLHAWASSR